MNHTITSSDISCHNINRISVVHNLDATFCSLHKINILPTKGSYGSSGNIGCHNSSTRNNVSGNNSSSLFSGQTFKGTCRQFRESVIGRSKDGNGIYSFQGLNKSEIGNNFDQSCE